MSSEEERKGEQRITSGELPIKEDLLYKGKFIQIGVTPYRFVIVTIYCLLNFCNAVHWVSFASCASNFGKNYDLNSFQVDCLSMIYMIIYPFACIPEAYLIDNKSMRVGIVISSILTITGAGIKCLINKGLFWIYIGQSLIPLFQPAILNCPGKIASTWFGEQSRVLVTSICCVSNTIGVLFGYLVHDWIVDSFSTGDAFKTQFELYLIVEFCLTAVLCLPTIFLMKSKPKIPPR